MMVNQSQ